MKDIADIFISYQREQRPQAEILARKLKSSGYTVWWDIDLLAGDDFAEDIEHVITHCKAFVVIWSEQAISSQWVMREVRKANVLSKPIFDISFDGSDVPFGVDNGKQVYAWKGNPEKLDPFVLAINSTIKASAIQLVDTKQGVEFKDNRTEYEVEMWRNARRYDSIHEYKAYIDEFGKEAIFFNIALRRMRKSKRQWFIVLGGWVGTVVSAIIAIMLASELSKKTETNSSPILAIEVENSAIEEKIKTVNVESEAAEKLSKMIEELNNLLSEKNQKLEEYRKKTAQLESKTSVFNEERGGWKKENLQTSQQHSIAIKKKNDVINVLQNSNYNLVKINEMLKGTNQKLQLNIRNVRSGGLKNEAFTSLGKIQPHDLGEKYKSFYLYSGNRKYTGNVGAAYDSGLGLYFDGKEFNNNVTGIQFKTSQMQDYVFLSPGEFMRVTNNQGNVWILSFSGTFHATTGSDKRVYAAIDVFNIKKTAE